MWQSQLAGKEGMEAEDLIHDLLLATYQGFWGFPQSREF